MKKSDWADGVRTHQIIFAPTRIGTSGMQGLDYYRDLVPKGPVPVEAELTQLEAMTVLKAYDYGTEALNDDERHQLNCVIGKLKDQIWP